MKIRQKIENWIKETTKASGVLVHPKELKNGDLTLIVNDGQAEEIFKKLDAAKIPEIEKVEFVAPRFINIFLSKSFFADSVKEILDNRERYGRNVFLKNQKTIIEYTDPNPLKEFHIGHLMSNAIGESISRIIEANGAEVKRANYQGDVGIHIACAVWGLIKKGGIKEDGSIKDKARYLGECYFYGATSLRENENLKEEIQEINKKIYERSDDNLNTLYGWARGVSLDYFETIYKKLGTKFDYYFFESEVGERGKQIVLEFAKKGVFEESDGAYVFRGEKRDPKLHTRVFLNSQGLPVYEAKELALAKVKYEKYEYDKSIVITGNEINEYFKVLLAAMKEVFPDLANKTIHISHGMMRLPSGKMSSRTGQVITAESLIEEVRQKVIDKIKDGNALKDSEEIKRFTEAEFAAMSEIVAIGAIKYSILRQAIGGDIIFDLEKSISFEGDSGPYLQYSAVRAKSVLEKALNFKLSASSSAPESWQTNDAERLLYRFPEIVERASKEFAPHYIATYLIELAGAFNSFYARERIVGSDDQASPYKIALTESVLIVLQNGLNLLGINVPQKM